ncbi:hypothetical protein [Saccharicrinis aurantiacus]|uniref:hypothetical protein n=1 Tax=Saccharicrinis aurantiacus TaxID=1849719 RepID=UPI0008384888|nr:hypothetical protein [Saccharicrinis aurantiacus]
MKTMKNLVLGLVLLLSTSTFAQELNNWQKQKLEKELSEMTEVLELNEKEIKKVTKIKTEQAIDADKIMKSVTKGTPEAKKAWQDHGREFNGELKNVLGEAKWNKWLAYKKNGKKAQSPKESSNDEGLTAAALKLLNSTDLNNWQKNKVEEEVSEMNKVMTLTPDQQKKVIDVKAYQYKTSENIMRTTKKGSQEQKDAWKKLGPDVSEKLLAATSKKQMQKWWAYNNNKKK